MGKYDAQNSVNLPECYTHMKRKQMYLNNRAQFHHETTTQNAEQVDINCKLIKNTQLIKQK